MDKESGNTEAHSELIQISKVKLFTKIVNGLLLSGLIPITRHWKSHYESVFLSLTSLHSKSILDNLIGNNHFGRRHIL